MLATAPPDVQELEILTQFLYLVPIGLVQTKVDGDIVMINPMSAQLLMPLSPDGQLVNLFDVFHDLAPDLGERARTYDQRYGMVCDGIHLQLYAGAFRPGRPQILSLTLLKLDSTRLMAVLSDVTASVRRERALRQSQAWIETLVTGISDYALMSLDNQGRVQCWNPGVARVTGFAAAQCVGRSYTLFYPADVLPEARALDWMHEARRDGWSLDEGWRHRADGSRFWGSCLIAPLDLSAEPADGEPAFSLIVRDISDRKDAHDALRQSVFCDHLTGLANRRAFFEAAEFEMQRWRRRARPLSMVMFDADDFKSVNDRHGHAAGDAVLRHLATALGATFRANDVVARVGGEEFAVLLPGTDPQGARLVAARLCAAVAAQRVEVEGATIVYTVSAGVASMAPDVDDMNVLMKRADAALYLAKANGKNRVECWTADLGSAPDQALAAAAAPRAI